MAVRVTRPDPPSIERIRQHRLHVAPAPPSRAAVATVRDVVRRSASVEDAVAAVKAVNAAWSDLSPATRQAVDLLLTILELSDSTEEALATYAMLHNDGTLLAPLRKIRGFVLDEFPAARMRIVPGDEVASAYLKVFIPVEDYPAFWAAHTRLRDWIIGHVPELEGVIHVTARFARSRV